MRSKLIFQGVVNGLSQYHFSEIDDVTLLVIDFPQRLTLLDQKYLTRWTVNFQKKDIGSLFVGHLMTHDDSAYRTNSLVVSATQNASGK